MHNHEQRFWIVVNAQSAEERTILDHCGLSIEEITDLHVSGIIDASNIQELVRAGFSIQHLTPLEYYIQDTDNNNITRSRYQFTPYESLLIQLQKIASDNPDVVKLNSIGSSYENRRLLILEITKHDQQNSKAGILFIGNHHAREHISTEFCLHFAYYLCEQKNNPAIDALLSSMVIYIIPMINPDGTEYDLSRNSYACWRKNRHINKNKSIGVDLNRNYDYQWTSAQSTQQSDTYAGEYPFSEPETRAVQSFLNNHTNIRIFISYHSYGEYILYPWGCTKKPIENKQDRDTHMHLAHTMASITGYKAMAASALYTCPGDAVDWAYGKKNMISLTVEMMPAHSSGCKGFYPSEEKAIYDDIEKNIKAALYACNICKTPYKIAAS
jgi:carboxypeptidase T